MDNKFIDLEQLSEAESKLKSIKQLLQDVIGLYDQLQKFEYTRILFSVKKAEGEPGKNELIKNEPGKIEPIKNEAAKQPETAKVVVSLHYDEQIKYIRDNFGKALSPQQIADHIGVSTSEVYAIAKNLKLYQVLPPENIKDLDSETEAELKIEPKSIMQPAPAIQKSENHRDGDYSTKSGKLTLENRKFIREKYCSGQMSPAEIARELKVSTPTIAYHIKHMGLSVLAGDTRDDKSAEE